MTMPDLAIEGRAVSKVYPGRRPVRALDGVSIGIRRGEFFTLLGPSGCGKTTLLRLVAGFEEPSAGELFLDGEPLAGLAPFRRPVNTVFQSYALFPHLSVGENVAFGLEMQRMAPDRVAERVAETLDLVRLADLGERRPSQLSGGQQQRVALARALANRPKVLLLDEPLSALDLKLRKEMQLELERLQNETGITFVFVTHDQEEALTMSDRIAVMRDGHILQIGTPTEIYERPADRFVADFIGDSNFLAATFAGRAGEVSRFDLEGGGSIESTETPECAPGARVTLAVRPERIAIDAGGELRGELLQIIYFGTDTTYHVGLGAQTRVQVRLQNREGAKAAFRAGDTVALRVSPEAVRVLVEP